MTFTSASIEGSYIIDPELHGDERGFFARIFCAREFASRGLASDLVQTNMSYSAERGTMRGLHYQEAPHQEAKLIRCTRGAVFDVVVDVRPESTTFMEWMGVELTAKNRRMVYVPEGCAHGMLTLVADTEVFYPVSDFYSPDVEQGIRYDDPAFNIDWPIDVRVISSKDRTWPDFQVSEHVPAAL